MSMTLRNSSGSSRVAGTAVPMPALLIEHVDLAELLDGLVHEPLAVLRLGHVGGHGDAAAAGGLDRLRVSSSFSTRRAQIATSAPASASPSANATPRPDDAPVTIATLPSSLK